MRNDQIQGVSAQVQWFLHQADITQKMIVLHQALRERTALPTAALRSLEIALYACWNAPCVEQCGALSIRPFW